MWSVILHQGSCIQAHVFIRHQPLWQVDANNTHRLDQGSVHGAESACEVR